MSYENVKKKRLWVPSRTWGTCIWIMADGKPLSDGDGYLSAEGFVDDKSIEKRVAEAARYWTESDEGHVLWVHGARKVTSSERDDQVSRLQDGYTPDPYEDFFDNIGKG